MSERYAKIMRGAQETHLVPLIQAAARVQDILDQAERGALILIEVVELDADTTGEETS